MSRDTQLIYGLHAVRHALEAAPEVCLELWLQDERVDAAVQVLQEACKRAGVAVHSADGRTLDRLVEGARHQGAVLRRRVAPSRGDQELDAMVDAAGSDLLLLALDGVEDPNNLGACLRTADAAGVSGVITGRSRGPGLTPAVYKVACGAADRVEFFRVANLVRVLTRLKAAGVRVVGATASGDSSIYAVDLCGPLLVVLGGEGRGLRSLTAKQCDQLVHIPMHGQVESLNVSVSTGILLYEAFRQRSQATR
jgi:23S rRNA (guanosine2251-2'-O)-methyltransferase